MIMDGVARYRPSMTLNCSIKQSERVEVCGAPGDFARL